MQPTGSSVCARSLGPWQKVSPGPCLPTATWRCRKNFNQWECSFHWKLHCHWLEFLRQRQIAVVEQGPGTVWYDIWRRRTLGKIYPSLRYFFYVCPLCQKIWLVKSNLMGLYSDVTLASWCLKWLATWLFVQHLIQADNKGNSKVFITENFWGESRGDLWISLTTGQ